MIPSRQTDPIGYAKWWMGPDLVAAAERQADAFRLQLHSGMVPGSKPKDVLKRLNHLERHRAILIRSYARTGGHIIFVFTKQLHDLFMAEAAERAAALKPSA